MVLHSEFAVENHWMVFSVFNPLMNDHLRSYFEVNQVIADSSFSSTIVKININGILKLILQSQIILDSEKENLIQQLKNNYLSEKEKLEVKSYSIPKILKVLTSKIDLKVDVGSIISAIIKILN